jgi:hypothetical protein
VWRFEKFKLPKHYIFGILLHMIIGALIFISAVLLCNGFLTPKLARRQASTVALSMNAGGVSKAMVMVRKKKMKEVEALLTEVHAEGADHYITVRIYNDDVCK